MSPAAAITGSAAAAVETLTVPVTISTANRTNEGTPQRAPGRFQYPCPPLAILTPETHRRASLPFRC